jgi:hypothetical protein
MKLLPIAIMLAEMFEMFGEKPFSYPPTGGMRDPVWCNVPDLGAPDSLRFPAGQDKQG